MINAIARVYCESGNDSQEGVLMTGTFAVHLEMFGNMVSQTW